MSEYLSRTGSVIVIMALIVAAVILATQFSFGRLFSADLRWPEQRGAAPGRASVPQWREERRKAKQRREVMVKYGKKDAPVEPSPTEAAEADKPKRRSQPRRGEAPRRRSTESRPAPRSASGRSEEAGHKTPIAPPLPLPEPERVERRLGAFTLPPVSLLDAPKAERKIDERELMDSARLLEEKCREFSVEGLGGPDSPGPGRHHLRVQARRRREVLEGDRPVGRPVPGDAGRVGADRSHPRQVHRRHPDSQSQPRGHLAARAARVRRLHAHRPRS